MYKRGSRNSQSGTYALHSHLLTATKAADGACRRVHYSLLNTVNCPAAMVLVGYGTHKQEAAALAGEDYRAELVSGLANGIASFCAAISPKAQLKPAHAEEIPPPPAPPAAPAKPAKPDTKKTTPAKGSSAKGSSSRRNSGSNKGNSSKKPASRKRRR